MAVVNGKSTLLSDWKVGDCMMKEGSEVALQATGTTYDIKYSLNVLTGHAFYRDYWYQRWFLGTVGSEPYGNDKYHGYVKSTG